MSKHTPEPWYFEQDAGFCSEIYSDNGGSVCTFVEDPSPVDVDRILSCVNACAGMEDPAKEIAEMRMQRDELLEALDDLYKGYVFVLVAGRDRIIDLGGQCDPVDVMEIGDPRLASARAVINKVKGGAA